MNKNDFIFLPLWWQTYVNYVLGLRKATSFDTAQFRQYELEGFVNALFLGGVIDHSAARRMRELVQNAFNYGSGLEDLLARHAA